MARVPARSGVRGSHRQRLVPVGFLILVICSGCPVVVDEPDDHGDTRAAATPIRGAAASVAGRIETATDVDLFRIVAPSAGTLVAWTTGDTDTVGALLDSAGTALAYDDNCGGDGNFRAQAAVRGGVNYVGVNGSNDTGSYALSVQLLAPRAFNIDLCYAGNTPAAAQRAAVDDAAEFWMSALVGDLRDVLLPRRTQVCDVGWLEAGSFIDDVVIVIELASIDGPERTLGQAGTCVVRETSWLPAVGLMTFDTADLEGLVTDGSFYEVVVHEMAHALGFGVNWRELGLLQLPTIECENPFTMPCMPVRRDTHFTGPSARKEFDRIDADYKGNKVPVENDITTYDSGGLDVHWRESVFATEGMTPSLDTGVPNPISRVTIASFADIGYRVEYEAAQPFRLPSSRSALRGEARAPVYLGDDVWRGPLKVIDSDGEIVRVINRE